VPVKRATTGVVFEMYVEKALAPTLRHGQAVVMDTFNSKDRAGAQAYRGQGL
jgi:hypothetical protein